MADAELPNDIASVLLPMQGRPWLLPSEALAEVLPLRQPDRPGRGGNWLLGWLSWKDQNVPLISFERLNEADQMAIGPNARYAVIKSTRESPAFYAVIIQDLPRQVTVGPDDAVEEPVESGPAEAMLLQLGEELVMIPDIDKIEQAISSLPVL